MSQYKDHPIYGFAVYGGDDQWHCRGLVIDAGDKVTEIQKLSPAELSFKTEEGAKAHGLQLCKSWIDEQALASAQKISPTVTLLEIVF